MKNNLSVLFYLKKPKNYQSGLMPIYMRITLSGAPKKWNNKVGSVIAIETFQIKIEDMHLKLLRSDSEIRPEIIIYFSNNSAKKSSRLTTPTTTN